MMKKIGAFLLAVLFVATVLPMGVFPVLAKTYAGACGTNVTWSLDTASGVLTISGSGNMDDSSSNQSPWYSRRDYIRSVHIENSVTSIGAGAFGGCENLTSITIPDSVTSIGDDAFSYCYSLKSITIPDGVTSIGDRAFASSSLTSITIPDSVTSIGDSAFYDCSLTSITIPDSVTRIGDGTFTIAKT